MWLMRACLSVGVLLDLARAVPASCFLPAMRIAAISTATGMTILGVAVVGKTVQLLALPCAS